MPIGLVRDPAHVSAFGVERFARQSLAAPEIARLGVFTCGTAIALGMKEERRKRREVSDG
jgi:hypothetical protein